MRDPKRIQRIMEQVERIWKENPDMRLGQVFELIKERNQGPVDSFYVEDGEWEILLKE